MATYSETTYSYVKCDSVSKCFNLYCSYRHPTSHSEIKNAYCKDVKKKVNILKLETVLDLDINKLFRRKKSGF